MADGMVSGCCHRASSHPAISHGHRVMNWFTSILGRPPIGWWDLADILVVSVLIYEVLKLIRGTRAVQMALGGAVFVALFYGSRWGRLETVNWLIRNMLGYLVFAVIVLFQSDIRRALAHPVPDRSCCYLRLLSLECPSRRRGVQMGPGTRRLLRLFGPGSCRRPFVPPCPALAEAAGVPQSFGSQY